MAHLNIEKISLACRDREKEEQKRKNRKNTLLVLIHRYLEENGFMEAADALRYGSRFSVDEYEVCDNIYLESVLQDFESYYFLKYQKLPHFIKKINITNDDTKRTNIIRGKLQKSKSQPQSAVSSARKSVEKTAELRVAATSYRYCSPPNSINDSNSECDMKPGDPLGHLEYYNNEWKAMANLILQDVGKNNLFVDWSDIVGNESAKQLLKEAVVYPVKYRNLFSADISTWKSILLYGPTGTGKTLLSSVAAATSKATFFKVSISTLVSKWRGESEKIMKLLFDLAKHHAPSIIFIDEIDALLGQRGPDHEASRRMKTEFFLQMDSLSECNKFVLLLGATNMPWDLDHAVLRRMEKRVLVGLPDKESRISLFQKFLSNINVCDNIALEPKLNYEELAKKSENYSASDIELVCKEAKMSCLRRVIESLENYREGKILPQKAVTKNLEMPDILSALYRTKPATAELVEKYATWRGNHGSE